MSRRTTRSHEEEEFDSLVAARKVLRNPAILVGTMYDGRELAEIEHEALLAELETMAQLAEEALLPDDPERARILTAYAAVREPRPEIPAGM